MLGLFTRSYPVRYLSGEVIQYSSEKAKELIGKQSNCLQVMDDYLTEKEYDNFLKEIDGYMKRKRYEYSHWDDVCRFF